jgi:hypothetical protein
MGVGQCANQVICAESLDLTTTSDPTSVIWLRNGAGYGRQSGRTRKKRQVVTRREVNSTYGSSFEFNTWSGARDLNPGPHGPEIYAVPSTETFFGGFELD